MAASYKCTSVGCYSYQSPETNTLFEKLQTVVNQFAIAAAFDPITVDGIIGKGTTEKTLIVLGYLSELDQGVVGSSARALEAGINGPEQLAANAQAVTDTLVLATKQPPPAIAAQVTQPAPLPPAKPQPSATQIATTTANKPTQTNSQVTAAMIKDIKLKKSGLSTSLVDFVPPWVAYVGGGLLAIGALAAVTVGLKRRNATAAPVAGRW